MNDRPADDEFVRLLTEHQTQLRGFILASLGNHANSQDVLQATNMTLWKKASEFRTGAPFLPWALAIARFEILAFLRDHKRERLTFQTDIAEMMSEASATCAVELPARQVALRDCLSRLPDKHVRLLNLRYVHNQRIDGISKITEKSIDSVKSLLLRIRKSLGKCIERKLTEA